MKPTCACSTGGTSHRRDPAAHAGREGRRALDRSRSEVLGGAARRGAGRVGAVQDRSGRGSLSDRAVEFAHRHGCGIRCARDRSGGQRQYLRRAPARGSPGGLVSLLGRGAAHAGVHRPARRRSGRGGAQFDGRVGAAGPGRNGGHSGCAARFAADAGARANHGGRRRGAAGAGTGDGGAREHARQSARLCAAVDDRAAR